MCWTQNVRSAWYRPVDCPQPHILPESGGELYVQLPDDNGEIFTGSIFEPISLRVRVLDLLKFWVSLNVY
jgi:hypothetical protein